MKHFLQKIMVIILALFFWQTSAMCLASDENRSCIYRIECHDMFGDGWNGGSVSIIQNGNEVFQGGLIEGSYGVYFFELQSDVPIEIHWHPGGWAFEVFFDIVTPDDQILFSAPAPEESLPEWAPGVEDVLLATVTPYCPDCYPVAAIELLSLTATSAHLTWFSFFEQFHVEYGFAGFTQGTGTFETIYGENSVMLTDLVPNTAYDFYVQSLCDNGAWSDWKSLSFTTLQTPAVIPYSHGFEDATENGKWALINGTQTNKWYIGSTVAQAGSNALFISNTGNTHTYTNTSTSYTFAQRLFQIPEKGVFNVSFNWMNSGENNYDIVRAFFVPNDITLAAGGAFGMTGSLNTVPYRWIEVSGALSGYSSWQNFTGKVVISDAGNYNLVFFWKNDANGGSQPPAAIDNIEITPSQWIAGTYTIDNTQPTADRNFNSFAEALTALNEYGILDTITFLIPDGQIHNITLTNNNGLQITSVGTATRPVFFRKAGTGANPLLKVTGTSNSADACFTVDNSHYITFDGLDIENVGTSSANNLERGFCLTNSSTNIKILNGTINLKSVSNSYGIYIPNVTNGSGSPTNQIQQFYTDNLTIKRATYGYSFSSNITNRYITISRARIDSVTTGVVSNGSNLASCIIQDSKITNATTGLSLSSADFNMQIYNNVIHATESGVYIGSSSASDVYYLAHNTIYIPPTANSAYGVRKNSTTGRVALTNNIIINKSTNSSYSRALYVATTDNSGISTVSNNNIYYCAAGVIYQNSSTTRNSVNGYIDLLGDGRESNSVQTDVPFISTTAPFNFNIQPDVPTKAESGGQVYSWVPADINGIPRFGEANYSGTGTAPDIGAYEFEGVRDTTTASSRMNGLYTIDNSRPTGDRNFNSFPEAIAALNSNFISDTTIFETVPGQVHNISITAAQELKIMAGGNPQRELIFRKSNSEAANTVLKITGTSNSADACFYIDGVNYITFNGLDIQNTGTTSSNYLEQAFYLNNANYIKILNCNIRLRNQSGNYSIYATSTTNGFYSENVSIKNSYYAYYFSGSGTGSIIDRTSIDSVTYGIYNYNNTQNQYVIKNSKIYNASNYGIYLYAGNNQQVFNNVIHTAATGIYATGSNLTDTLYFAHNTIYVHSTTSSVTCITKYSGGNTNGRIGLYNNIFINKSSNVNSSCFYCYASNTILQGTNNNVYFCEYGAVFQNSSGTKTMAEYRDLLGDERENNSQQTDVPFISTTHPLNFDIQAGSSTKAESGGKSLSWVQTDINGAPRFGITGYTGTGSAPDIGAYEFEGVPDTTAVTTMYGVYTINNTLQTAGRNFNKFEEAFSALNDRGISNAVTFEIAAGQVHNIALTNPLGLRIVALGDIEKPIIFQKSGSGANPLLKLTATSGTNDACFYLNNAHYITFDGLNIENVGTASSNYLEQAFYLANASHITIRNCNIRLRNASSNYAIYGYNNVNSLLAENNTIKNAYYGYYFYNNGTYTGNTISHNVIDSVNIGIFSGTTSNNFSVKSSKITNANTGIELSNGNNQRFFNNVVHASSYGISFGLSATDTVYLAHNTVYMFSTTSSYCMYKGNSSGRIGLYNNILINKSTGTSSVCFRGQYMILLPESNNNIYYCANGGICEGSSGTYYALNDYIALLDGGRESLSVQADVPFISTVAPFNFNINTAVPTKAESGGQPLAWIDTDIDENDRNLTTPDIGAYEFEGIIDSTDLSPMHGIYTININMPTKNRNFNSFQEAILAFTNRSTSDTVIFETVPEEVHQIALTSASGLSFKKGGTADKPIIFRKSNPEGGNTILKVTGTSGADACFTLENVNYITFNGLTIENAGTASSNYLERAFYLNYASNISILNCNIRLRNSSGFSGIYIAGTVNLFHAENVKITDSYYGYYLSTNVINSGNTISRSLIDNVYAGIYVSGSYRQNNFTIKESQIYNASAFGIYLYFGNNQRIYNNVIQGTGSSYSGIYWNNASATDTIYLAHNTVYVSATTSTTYCLRTNVSNGKLGLYNNIFINKSTSVSSRCFYNNSSDNSIILQGSNHNIYRCDAGGVYQYSSLTKNTVNEYITLLGDGRESASCFIDVPFKSTVVPFNFDVNPTTPNKAESCGQPLPWITTDIAGNPRQNAAGYTGTGTAPDVGAYEFEGIKDSTDYSFMAGNYTIDQSLPTSGRNFRTFKQALIALTERGTADSVFFNIPANSVFNQTSTADTNRLIFNFSGTVNKPITFRKSGEGNKPIFNFTGTSSTSDYAFNIQSGMQYITFDGLDIRNAGTTSADFLEVAFYINTASNITVKNCNIRMNNNANSSYAGIYLYNNATINTLENNRITHAYYAIYANSGTGSANIIKGNLIDSVFHALYILSRQNNLIVDGNKLFGLNSSSSYGVGLNQGFNMKIYNNVVSNFSYGLSVSNSTTTDTSTWAHNTVLTPATGNIYGIYNWNSSKMRLMNNIIVNRSTGTSSFCFYNANNETVLLPESNNNLYWCSAGRLYRSSTSTSGVTTLSAYQALFSDGRETHSKFENPPFISVVYPYNFDLRTDTVTYAESGGKFIPAIVQHDIEGKLRAGASGYNGNGLFPDIGAYEFDGQGTMFQVICSGSSTLAVDFSAGQGQSFNFTLANTPQYLTGYVSSGVNQLPAMTVVNSSSEYYDTLRYNVVSQDATISFEYRIIVKNSMNIGTLSENIFPANGSALANTSAITFTWESVADVDSYDFWFWNSTGSCPTTPTGSNLTLPKYIQTSGLAYGNTYFWKIKAKNSCLQLESDIFSFEIRALPNLHVSHIAATEIDDDRTFTLSWTVRNDGAGATVEPQWTDKIWLLNNIANNNGTNTTANATLMHQTPNLQTLAADGFYTNSTQITLPGRWHGNYWLVVAADMNQVYNIQWSPAGGTPPEVYQPSLSGTPYPYLYATGYNSKIVLEEGETNYKSDNFFYQKLTVPRPPMKPLIIPAHDTVNFINRVVMMQDSILLPVIIQDLITPITLTFKEGNTDAFSAYFAPNWSDSLGGNIVLKFHPQETGTLFSNLIIAAANKQDTVFVTGKSILPTMYDIWLSTNQEIYADTDTVHVAGYAKFINGWNAGNVLVNISVEVLGYKRQYQVVTNTSGHFTFDFVPQIGESGHYKIYAFKPGYATSDVKDEFDIPGMKLYSSSYIRWDTELEIPLEGKLAIQNRSAVPLTNVQIELIQGVSNANVTFEPISTLPGSGVVNMNYTVTGTDVTTSGNWEEMRWRATCNEGVTFLFSTWFHCKPTFGILAVEPARINTLITKGAVKLVEFSLTNNGNGPTGAVAVSIPKVEWMTLVSPDTMPSIAPNESAVITLWLAPTNTTPLHVPFTGTIAINCANGNGISIPYTIQAISDSTGTLVVDVVDEYYFNTTAAPHLANAKVKVTHPYSFVTVAEGYTDTNGLFTVENIPEGYYKLHVEAPNHSSYTNNILIEAGQTLNKQIFLEFQAITYSWQVVPTEIEDHYEITLITTYETQVPKPVVIVNMPVDMPYLIGEETYNFNIIYTNIGLITAENMTINFPDDPEYTFDFLMNGFDIPAHNTVIVPVVMRRIDPYGEGGGTLPDPVIRMSSRGGGPCNGMANHNYEYWCGEKKKTNTNTQIKYAGRVCSGTGGIGGGTGGGGNGFGGGTYGGWGTVGSGGNANIPIIWKEPDCCEPSDVVVCALQWAFTLVGCIPGPQSAPLQIGRTTIAGAVGGYTSGLAGGGSSAGSAINAGAGMIPGAGCVWSVYSTLISTNCYKAVRCLLGLGGGGFGGGSGGSGGGSGGSGGGSGGGGNPKSSGGEKITPLRVSPDNWTFDYDAVEERLYHLGMIETYFNQIEDEIFGNPEIFENEHFVEFAAAIEDYMNPQPVQIPLDDYNIMLSGMPDSLYIPFIQRYNTTLEAHVFGVYTPNETYPNIINRDIILSLADSIQTLIDYALSEGYVSLEDMHADVMQDLKWAQEDINSFTNKGVCATVTLQLTQTMTLTREAFRGTLSIHNGNTDEAMTNIHLELEIRDENGALANNLFQIETEKLHVMTEIDGTGTLAPSSDGTATVLFIPTVNAAPTEVKIYSFGGTLSYTDPFTGETVTAPLFPVALEVHPSPYLDLHYFWQRDILGDDPFTEPIEPSIPAEIGVLIHNKGYGEAKNVLIESAQPEIIENEKGLLINFNLIGSSFNGKQKQLGLLDIHFGNIAPHKASVGIWYLTASLLGHFTSYAAHVVHLDSRGNPDLSLVDKIEIHELIRSINAYGSLDDSIPDFLVNNIADSKHYPDNIYFSNATKSRVWLADTAYCDGVVTPAKLQVNLAVKPDRVGWNYAHLNDPANNRYKLIQVIREDNQEIPLTNVWQTFVTMPDNFDPVYENKLHFVDTFSTTGLVNYTLIFDPKTANPLRVDSIVGVPKPPQGEQLTIIDYPLEQLSVYFNKAVYQPTFTWKDMELHCQGGDNLIDSTIVPQKITDSVYVVNIAQKTTEFGFYNFIVQTAEIYDTQQYQGEVGKQVTWVQNVCSAITTFKKDTICQGDTYDFYGEPLTDADEYEKTFHLSNGCDSIIKLTLTVNPASTIALTSAAGTQTQTVCSGTAITNTVFTFGGSATNATVTNLPAGLTQNINTTNKTVTISGTPTESGTYTITTSGHAEPCTAATIAGAVIVNPLPIVDLGGDIILDMDDSVLLSVEEGHSYLWSTGETTSQITITRDMFNSDTSTVWVLVTTENYCTGSDTIQIIFTVGITIYNQADYFKLYPNPSTGKFYLEFKEIGIREVNIYDLLGRTVYKGNFEGEKLELEILQTGTYVIDVNHSIRAKVVIMR